METWINDLFRSIISILDGIAYWMIELLGVLFNKIANINLFDGSTIVDAISNRVYILIAIIMIFKVSFSIIQYIINPDTFTDKERGMGKIIQNVVVTLVCLVGVPQVFPLAYELQGKIVNSHVVESLILGIDVDLNKENQEQIYSQIPFTILSAFITPNTTNISYFTYNDGVYACGGEEMLNGNQISLGFQDCVDMISKEGKISITIYDDDNKRHDILGGTGTIFQKAYEYYDYNLLLKIVNHKTSSDQYIFEYKLILSTVAGIFVAIIYLNFCFDLAIRSVKFAFLQLIAPIPIISMIDPKSSKSGMMSKWVKSCISTYIGLFIRIAAVSFVVLIISLISSDSVIMKNIGDNFWVKLMIIFGAMMFAKELPKLISDLTGINLDGNFKMNPFSRIPGAGHTRRVLHGAGRLGGAALTGAAGAIGGGIAAGWNTGLNKPNAGSIIGSTVMGMGRGLFGGMREGYGSGLRGTVGAARQTVSGIGNRYKNYGSSTLGGRIAASAQMAFGAPTGADNIENEIKILEEYSKFKSQMTTQAEFDTSDLLDTANNGGFNYADILGNGANNQDIRSAAKGGVKSLKEYYENLQNSGTATVQQVAAARDAYEKARKFVVTYADKGVLGHYETDSSGNLQFITTNNRTVSALKNQARSYASRYAGQSEVMRNAASADTYAEIDQATIAAQNAPITLRDDRYDRLVSNRDAVNNTRRDH